MQFNQLHPQLSENGVSFPFIFSFFLSVRASFFLARTHSTHINRIKRKSSPKLQGRRKPEVIETERQYNLTLADVNN